MSAKNTAVKSSSSKKNEKAGKGAKAEYSWGDQPQARSGINPAMRDDLIGIGLAVLGIVLLVAVIMPGDALVSSTAANGLRHLFGLGAFVIPFAFMLWGISYFVKTQDASIGRLIGGVIIILIALMGLFSLFNAGVREQDTMTIFDDQVLVYGGGYVGSGLSWALLTGLGRPIAAIIEGALILVGLVLVGFSISSVFLFARNFADQIKPSGTEASDLEPEIRLGNAEQVDFDDVDSCVPQADETIVFGSSRSNKRNRFFGEDAEDFGTETGQEFDMSLYEEDVDLDAAKTVELPTAKRRKGAKTTRLAKKGAKAQADAQTAAVMPEASKAKYEVANPQATPTEGFVLPSVASLKVSGKRNRTAVSSELEETAAQLQRTLEEFSLPAKVVGWLAGPTVTCFKVSLPSGVKLAKITGLADDIALSLAASSVRIAQIPSTSLVGVEIPNKTRVNVLLGDILPNAGSGPLQMAIGEDVDGNKVCVDLAKMPHLLIGGTTGSGKSVCINGMIMSILMRSTPAEVRMIMIDPKRVEFSGYNGIPHLYVPVVTEPKEAAAALRWGVIEMERRLKVFEHANARNIGQYNLAIKEGRLANEEGESPDEMPFIVIVIDELSDLMMAAGKDVEDSIVRISQLARAAGIHLIVATQRPSSNVVTGMIKANITNRIALLVATGVDSRVILDASGAEKLVGNGDMLFSKPEWGKPKRIQGCYVSDEEIAGVVEHLREQGVPEYHPEILHTAGGSSSGGNGGASMGGASEDDPLIWEAADAVVNAGMGSTSMLQRRLKVGYARAGRIMDMLEQKGIVGPADGSKAREVLIDTVEDLEAIKAFEAVDQGGY